MQLGTPTAPNSRGWEMTPLIPSQRCIAQLDTHCPDSSAYFSTAFLDTHCPVLVPLCVLEAEFDTHCPELTSSSTCKSHDYIFDYF